MGKALMSSSRNDLAFSTSDSAFFRSVMSVITVTRNLERSASCMDVMTRIIHRDAPAESVQGQSETTGEWESSAC